MEDLVSSSPQVILFGGPAGSGKSTLAKAWCATRERAAHIQLDEVRSLIVAGYADPQLTGDLQGEQFHLSVRACCALAREYLDSGYDVAIDDVLFPGAAFDASWRHHLAGIDWRVVIIHPTLEETLARSSNRDKKVPAHLVREQHQATFGWPERYRIDTTGLSVADSLTLVVAALDQ
ncbi:MAG: AAA family ATPase [Chloroflexota bacterium]|nr:AAA family ATPase [Chloroflexota bacterium]